VRITSNFQPWARQAGSASRMLGVPMEPEAEGDPQEAAGEPLDRHPVGLLDAGRVRGDHAQDDVPLMRDAVALEVVKRHAGDVLRGRR
jgi:hypothetical protein